MALDANTRRDNRELLERLSRFLNECPDAITVEEVEALVADGRTGREEAFSLLLAAMCGLDMADSARDRALYHRYFPLMARRLDAARYRADPYYQTIFLPVAKTGAWEFRTQGYRPFEAFVCNDLETLSDGRVIPPVGFFEEPFSYPAVLENGREWMTLIPNEVETMKPAVQAARGRVLTYGLGLGYFAFMAAQKAEVERVDIVERDEAVIRLFQNHLLPQFPNAEKIAVIHADAFAFAEARMGAGRYATVFTDLWHDPSDGLALYRRMKALEGLSPGSTFVYWIEKTLLAYQALWEEGAE